MSKLKTTTQNTQTFQIKRVFAFIVWVGYQVVRLCLGLIVHPYRTVREIMRGRWFVPLVFLPSGILVWLLVSGRVGAWVVELPVVYRDTLGLLLATVLLSLFFWQALLFYLGVRFWVGLRR